MARPLTKKDKTGRVYIRPPDIENKIDLALKLGPPALKQHLLVTTRTAPDYLPSECLVYLIRDAMRRKDESVVDMVLPVLLARCEANLKSKIQAKNLGGIDAVCKEALSDFCEMLASDGAKDNSNPDELDYYECKFNKAFRGFRIDFLRREFTRSEPIENLPYTDDGDDEAAHAIWERLSQNFRTSAPQDGEVFRRQLLDAINALPAEERKAVVLCRILGYEIESEDPEKQTAATLLKVCGRTIRNYLSRAAAKLSQFKE